MERIPGAFAASAPRFPKLHTLGGDGGKNCTSGSSVSDTPKYLKELLLQNFFEVFKFLLHICTGLNFFNKTFHTFVQNRDSGQAAL